ncbi:unnamed protein product [Didymodactylos carnosus]|uniref:Uncharacterized protein n=1 Tax=Didymodactylos carnosus TaxID=1234261 RepID=A0A814Y621_9BILA|nr:unnamed protein product [Didymodactylos carnosus]CAF3987905.1 unnamed protein product [Didymodactylos carnosus]
MPTVIHKCDIGVSEKQQIENRSVDINEKKLEEAGIVKHDKNDQLSTRVSGPLAEGVINTTTLTNLTSPKNDADIQVGFDSNVLNRKA